MPSSSCSSCRTTGAGTVRRSALWARPAYSRQVINATVRSSLASRFCRILIDLIDHLVAIVLARELGFGVPATLGCMTLGQALSVSGLTRYIWWVYIMFSMLATKPRLCVPVGRAQAYEQVCSCWVYWRRQWCAASPRPFLSRPLTPRLYT